jgi:hypothetical protein
MMPEDEKMSLLAELDDEQDCYNNESFMYCLCFRFNTLICSDKPPATKQGLIQKIQNGQIF